MAHFLCHLGCSHFGALLLDFYFTENNYITEMKKIKHYSVGKEIFSIISSTSPTAEQNSL